MRTQKGFTLIESLVAISILVSVIIGVTSAVQKGISSYTYSKEQIVAFYLAQEGVEQIRWMRDNNGLADNNWLAGIAQAGDPCAFGSVCIVDAVLSTLSTCSGTCPNVRQDATTGLYGHDSADPQTIYRREIRLTSINADEVAITVTVSWTSRGVARTFKVRENIFNWQ